MTSNDGYQIVEPQIIQQWLNIVVHREFLVALLYWLAERLTKQLSTKYPGIEVSVIKVQYHGAYPCIGIRYPDESVPDLCESSEQSIENLIRNTSVLDFIQFVFSSKKSWSNLSKEFSE